MLLRRSKKSPWSRRARRGRSGKISHWWGILRSQSARRPVLGAAPTAEPASDPGKLFSANGARESNPAPIKTIGSAVVLDFDYLKDVFVVHEIGPGKVCLSGGREPPAGTFEILVHVAEGFVEYTASVQQQTAENLWLLAVEALSKPRFLQRPARKLGTPELLPVKRKIV